METLKTGHGFDEHGAPPPTSIGNEMARQQTHAEQTANVEAREQTEIPLSNNNSKMVIPSGANEADFAALRQADADHVPERVTADDMRKVNALKPGTFTAREIAGAEIEPQHIESMGNPTEASQLREQAAASSGASISDADGGQGARDELVGSESTASIDSGMEQTGERVLETTKTESDIVPEPVKTVDNKPLSQ